METGDEDILPPPEEGDIPEPVTVEEKDNNPFAAFLGLFAPKDKPKDASRPASPAISVAAAVSLVGGFAHLAQSIIENPMMNGEVIRIDGALRMPLQ